jgi:hypothetical protein
MAEAESLFDGLDSGARRFEGFRFEGAIGEQCGKAHKHLGAGHVSHNPLPGILRATDGSGESLGRQVDLSHAARNDDLPDGEGPNAHGVGIGVMLRERHLEPPRNA